jgi:hypothetical protein
MKKIIMLLIRGIAILTTSSAALAIEPATGTFDERGFSIQAPSNASMLSLRLAGSKRTVLHDERTGGVLSTGN